MKRIILCSDGTWNTRDMVDKKTGRRHPTNVTKVARSIKATDKNGVPQIVYYLEGVGTNGPLDRVTGGAFGEGIEVNIIKLYRFIAYNYEDGDEIYLFGFSRGAFTARSLIGFMNKIGLVEKDDDYYVPEIFDLYEKRKKEGSEEWGKAFHNIVHQRPCPPIKFIGVWDTVGALGAPGIVGQLFNKKKYKFHDVGLNDHIENAYQALAVDERRKPFKPSIWKRPPNWKGQLEQSWFAGVHSNVGGSYSPDGLANEALHWIVQQAEELGLEFDTKQLAHYRACFNSVLRDSMTTAYKVLGPYQREIGLHLNDNECIHQSVLDRIALAECHYNPVNVKHYEGIPVVNTTRVERGTPC